jgi:uncharacterized protein
MLLDLSKIRTAHERYDKTYPAEAFVAERADFRVAEPVTLGFDIYKDKDQFHIVGDVKTTLELSCSRCLEPFALPVDSHFDLRYQPHAQNTGEGEREIEEDDLTTAFYEDEQIDLRQLMDEQFYLSLPMKPLCGSDCNGLCPVCGKNLNRDTCECRRTWDDPRFAALRELRTKN